MGLLLRCSRWRMCLQFNKKNVDRQLNKLSSQNQTCFCNRIIVLDMRKLANDPPHCKLFMHKKIRKFQTLETEIWEQWELQLFKQGKQLTFVVKSTTSWISLVYVKQGRQGRVNTIYLMIKHLLRKERKQTFWRCYNSNYNRSRMIACQLGAGERTDHNSTFCDQIFQTDLHTMKLPRIEARTIGKISSTTH